MFRPYLFPKYSGFGKEFQQKKEPPRVGIRMGFLIAKHILYSGKTMDQTNEILFIQEKRKEIVNLGFQRYTKRNVTSSSWMFRSWEHINGGG